MLGLAWQSSPALTEVEEVATDWLRQMLGLSDGVERRDSGHGVDDARWSRCSARANARRRTASPRGGLQAESRPLVVYASAHAHSSVDKAALLAGFGRDNVRHVAHDEAFAMRAGRARARDRRRSRGRTGALRDRRDDRHDDDHGARSDRRDIAAIAARHGLWLHVDAAMAGSAMILPECRWMWDGIEGADSLVVNPHKWLGAAFDCSVYFVRDPNTWCA